MQPQIFPEKLALVIPTRYEAGNILSLLHRIHAALDGVEIGYELLIVDDDSGDGIADLVSAISQSDTRVRFLVRRGERGLSGAILHGWQHTDAEILGVIDADLQHPPELLPDLLTAIIEGCDLAVGSRYSKGAAVSGWNPIRRFISTAAVLATRPLQRNGLRICDPLSGFFMVRRRCIDGILFQKTGFKLLLEILVRGRIRSVKEIPLTFGLRHSGRSKAGLRTMFDYAALLARLYRERLIHASPTPAITADH
ncbi:MAG TPA: polyprenol monophosphomannose synthase [Terracidiphilus sp.]|nr:polyprenol monophosphomannose synthase [Terracidiphilus sp.]